MRALPNFLKSEHIVTARTPGGMDIGEEDCSSLFCFDMGTRYRQYSCNFAVLPACIKIFKNDASSCSQVSLPMPARSLYRGNSNIRNQNPEKLSGRIRAYINSTNTCCLSNPFLYTQSSPYFSFTRWKVMIPVTMALVHRYHLSSCLIRILCFSVSTPDCNLNSHNHPFKDGDSLARTK